MRGVFGKYDWLANSVLFGLYHLHKPWSILTNIVIDLGCTWPSRRFRSNWMAIVVHGAEGILGLVFFLAVILGLVG
jgi:membrane protease YdiL (CAAX protease family)